MKMWTANEAKHDWHSATALISIIRKEALAAEDCVSGGAFLPYADLQHSLCAGAAASSAASTAEPNEWGRLSLVSARASTLAHLNEHGAKLNPVVGKSGFHAR